MANINLTYSDDDINLSCADTGGPDQGDDFYRVFMLEGETLDATATLNSSMDGVLALFSSNTSCTGTTCDTDEMCIDDYIFWDESFTGFVAPHSGWYTIVVDTKNDPGSAYDDYTLDITLHCSQADCNC